MNKLEKEILKVITFFNLSQKTLTLDEIWQFLHRIKASRVQVLIGLQNLEKENQIIIKDEQYFLTGKVFDQNQNNDLIASRWKKAERFAKLFSYAPFVRTVCVTGSLANGTSKEESDINLLLIAKKNRKWLAKASLTTILEAAGQNRNKWYKAGKFSIDIVLDETDLDISKLKFNKDAYSAYFLARLVPILDRGGYKKLILENAWLGKELPNWQIKEINQLSIKRPFFEKVLLGDLSKKIISFLDSLAIKEKWEALKAKKQKAEELLLKKYQKNQKEEFAKKWEHASEEVSK